MLQFVFIILRLLVKLLLIPEAKFQITVEIIVDHVSFSYVFIELSQLVVHGIPTLSIILRIPFKRTPSNVNFFSKVWKSVVQIIILSHKFVVFNFESVDDICLFMVCVV